MTKCIIFDMDGTLIDSEKISIAVWKKIADEFGIANMEQTITQCIGVKDSESEAIFHRMYGNDFPYQKYRELASDMFHKEIEKNGLPVKPGVYELFQFLKDNHYLIGLASSTPEEIVRREMASIGLLNYFHGIMCGDMVSNSKPHPEIYLEAARTLGVRPTDCYAVEDAPKGILSAYHAGMRTIMVPDFIQPDEALKKIIFRQFQNLSEVRNFLQNQDNSSTVSTVSSETIP